MGIRNTVLAAAALNTAAPATKEDRAPAEFYLNIGIETGDPQFPFLDLHKSGIALDRVPEHEIRGDADTPWKQFAASQDALKAAMMQEAETLQPGETRVIARDEDTGICIQLRRVNLTKNEQPVVAVQLNGLSFRRPE